jgi:glutamine amidotransferase
MSGPRIGIVDAGAANYASIAAALARAGAESVFVRAPHEIERLDALVLPGVANLGYILDALDARALRVPLERWIAADLPLLGICAGFQALFEGSDEAGERRGFGIFAGRVRGIAGPKRQHIGWSRVQSEDGAMLGWAYFAHGYAAPESADAWGYTVYGERFVSTAQRGRVMGVQFHPERSASYGRDVLDAFVREAGVSYAR